jgi:integrase
MEQGADYQDLNLIFATEIGTPLLWRNLGRRHLKPLLTTAGIPADGFSLYSLRHTHCTLRIMNGDNLLAIARDMGTSVTMIDLTYGHIARPKGFQRQTSPTPLRHLNLRTRTLFAHQNE